MMVFAKRPVLLKNAMILLQNKEEAEDLVGDSLLRALEKEHLFKKGTNLNAWLFTIQRNTFINKYRKEKKSIKTNEITDKQHPFSIDSIENTMLLKQVVNLINNHSNSNWREAIMLVSSGYEYHEIAEKLDIPIGTVKSRVHLMRKYLNKNI